MKVIFLDIDGVLNSLRFFRFSREADSVDSRGPGSIDKKAVKNLNWLVISTGAKVVISSSWRLNRTLEEMQEILRKSGFSGEVIDMTSTEAELQISNTQAFEIPSSRWILIDNWLSSAEDVSNFVILDDIGDMYDLSEFHVKTDPVVGLTENDVDKAIEILNRSLF